MEPDEREAPMTPNRHVITFAATNGWSGEDYRGQSPGVIEGDLATAQAALDAKRAALAVPLPPGRYRDPSMQDVRDLTLHSWFEDEAPVRFRPVMAGREQAARPVRTSGRDGRFLTNPR